MLSFIVCYRDREEHLEAFTGHLRHYCQFNGIDQYEVIVVEQNDTDRFRRGCLLNEGVKVANGDIVVLHDVDYLPSLSDVVYWPETTDSDVFLPCRRVEFVEMSGLPRAEEDIPSGYRHFKNGVDDNFYGAVTSFRKSSFEEIGGFNPLYNGWGLEDADLRERINLHGLTSNRGNGTFHALPHKDSFPGLNDEAFQHNQRIFAEWQKYTHLGMNNLFCTNEDSVELAKKYNVDRWIKVSNMMIVNDEAKHLMTVDNVSQFYEDMPEVHTAIWNGFKSLVNSTPALKNHRDWVVQNNWGYGNRAFHWMWNLLVQQAPMNFKFLEIGVFKGQTISLLSMLNSIHKKNGSIYGITPLDKSGDKYATHPDIDYEAFIQQIYSVFGLDASDLSLIQGFSQEPQIISIAEQEGPFDLVYVDGCHDYEVVVSDLQNYGNMLNVGGYLIVDDASNNLKIPNGLIRMDWRGLPDVSKAVSDTIETNEKFIHKFAVGHNRVFQRVK
jgi:hypothetical protein